METDGNPQESVPYLFSFNIFIMLYLSFQNFRSMILLVIIPCPYAVEVKNLKGVLEPSVGC